MLLRDVAVTRPVSYDQLWSKPGFSQEETLQLLLCETSFCWFEKKIIGLWWLLLEWFVLWQIIITRRHNIVESGAVLVCSRSVEPQGTGNVQVRAPTTPFTRWSVGLLLPVWLNLLISESSCRNVFAGKNTRGVLTLHGSRSHVVLNHCTQQSSGNP